MSTPVPPSALSESERRRADDRRAEPTPSRRAPKRSLWVRWLGIAGRDVAIALASVTAIVFAVRRTQPIYANHPTVVAQLLTHAPNVARAVIGPTPADTSRVAQLMASPQFEKDRQAFAADLVATGRMTQARADSVAYYAVREAYTEGIPPAVVFGVMLTENSQFVSGAKSNVGAVGLMQVYPKVWLKALSARFGKDLSSDSTNLKYGIYILKQYIKSDSGSVTQRDVGSGLLHYNGCVHGSNTPSCKNYPNKVKGYVESLGSSICGDKSFYDCIAKPFVAGLMGKQQTPAVQTQ
ncbi:MAG: transglycosylase SLT domain-containing protein [Gemmatimonadaceae bacterium]